MGGFCSGLDIEYPQIPILDKAVQWSQNKNNYQFLLSEDKKK